MHGEEGGAFLIAADGAVEGVEVGLDGFADLVGDFGRVGFGKGVVGVFFGGGGADVGFEVVKAAGEGEEVGGVDGGCVVVGGVDGALEVEGPGLDHLDEVGDGTDFRGEDEYREVVVGYQTF